MTRFEAVIDQISTGDYTDLRENCIYWLDGDQFATVNFSQKKYRNRIKKMAEDHPDDVNIMSDTDAALVAVIPVRAVKTSIVTREPRELTDEEREAVNARLEAARRARRNLSTR